ncbi:hypothetical protein chiPu_0007659 [Chiloscyllium punctatum]|uniref:Uncharacterized protein n=1 Tax=Chiloscyllium punctatum TaxID=137246 RepID=A0A401SFM2_CHIPU|nr:hypothetical protein [Chiloscyllium punctatum]
MAGGRKGRLSQNPPGFPPSTIARTERADVTRPAKDGARRVAPDKREGHVVQSRGGEEDVTCPPRRRRLLLSPNG